MALRLVLDRGRGLRLRQRGHRDQRGDLGGRFLRRPAAELADVDELDALLGDLAEQRRLLRAGDDYVVARADRGLERADILAAQLVMHVDRRARLERRRERFRVERDGAVATADLKRLAFQAHRRAWAFPLSFAAALRRASLLLLLLLSSR